MRRVVNFLLVFALLAPLGAAAQLLGDTQELERSLRLNPLQKEQFDLAVRATQRAMVAIGLGVLQAKSRIAGELLKDRPDPDVMFLAQEELFEFSKPHFRAARDEWLRLYAMMDDDQVRIARAYIEERLRRLENVAEILARALKK